MSKKVISDEAKKAGDNKEEEIMKVEEQTQELQDKDVELTEAGKKDSLQSQAIGHVPLPGSGAGSSSGSGVKK